MNQKNHNTESRKNKHLSYKERLTIQLRFQDRFTLYKIAKQLDRNLKYINRTIEKYTIYITSSKMSLL